MPRPTNFVAFIRNVVRNVVRDQVQEAVQGLLGAVGAPKKKAKNGRRRRRRRRGPGRPPGDAAAARCPWGPKRLLGGGDPLLESFADALRA